MNSPMPRVELPLTDLGNAERLVARHSHCLRYCYPWRKWLFFNGQHWAVDDTGEVERRAADTARWLIEESRQLASQAQEETGPERERLLDVADATFSWSRRSESAKQLRAMIELSKSRPGIPVKPDQLDVNPWALNTINGTIDLSNGELRRHNADDLITKLCPVEFQPDARYTAWDEFLNRILPDADVQSFVQRAAGYSITGLTTEEVFFFPFGPSATGKSTFLRAISGTLGDYAAVADFDTFLEHNRSGASNDIARLAGKRLVLSVEVSDGAKFAEGLVQQVTGGDRITARHLYAEFFEFVPAFKLWLASNNRPKVRDDNGALWRRIVQIPFTEHIPEEERDSGLKTALCDPEIAGPAILAWLVQGCLEWQKGGLRVPQQVRSMTQEYQKEMDPLATFLEECCFLVADATVANPQLREAYLRWAKANNVRRPLSQKGVAQRLKGIEGVSQVVHGRVRIWRGLGLISPGFDGGYTLATHSGHFP